MSKKIGLFILFFIFLYIARIIIINPLNKKSFLFIAIAIILIYLYLVNNNIEIALIIFLIYLPFYYYIRFKIFHNSIAGTASKDFLLILLFGTWLLKKIKNKESIYIPVWWKIAVFYFIIATINILKAPNLITGMLDWRIMVFYPLTAIMFFDIINTKEKLFSIMRVLIYIGVVVALIGFYQRIVFIKYGRNYVSQLFGIESIRTMYNEIFITSTVGHHGVLGIYLTILLTFLFIIHSEKPKMIPVWLKIGIVILFTLDIVFTSNRTAWVSFLIFVFFVFLTLKKNKMLYFLLMLGIFGGLILGNQFVSKRFSDILHPLGNESSFKIRYLGWQDKLRIALEQPLGVGLGQVGMTAKSNYGLSNNIIQLRGFSRVVDNLYFIIFIELGYPGFIFFFFFWFMLFLDLFKRYKLSKNSYNIVGLVMVIIFTIADFTGAYLNFILLQMYFWVLLSGVNLKKVNY